MCQTASVIPWEKKKKLLKTTFTTASHYDSISTSFLKHLSVLTVALAHRLKRFSHCYACKCVDQKVHIKVKEPIILIQLLTEAMSLKLEISHDNHSTASTPHGFETIDSTGVELQ